MRERCVHCGNDLPDGSQDFMCLACLRGLQPSVFPAALLAVAIFGAVATFMAWIAGAI